MLAFGLLLAGASVRADLRLARVFGDNMVLQQDQRVPVWGWADPGAEVSVALDGVQVETATADASGRWQVEFRPMSASAIPRELVATSGTNAVRIGNVLVGEVWICGGQSNMGLTLADCFDAAREIAAAQHPALRLLAVPSASSLLPAEDIRGGRWKVTSPETAAGFAGTAYFFGRKLHRDLDVPVGLIEFDRGATGIEGWVPLAAYRTAKEPELQRVYREVAGWDPQSDLGRRAHANALEQIRAWVPAAHEALAAGRPAPAQPRLPAPRPHQANPTEIFNGTVHPLAPFAVRGVVWYQGESNTGEGRIYEHKLAAMITGWRALWRREAMPFYCVQLANEGNPNSDPAEDPTFRYVPVREAQRRVTDRLPHTGLVVAIDLGEDASGHPRNKRDVGERLALWALAKQYGRPVVCAGPAYRGFRVQGEKMILTFEATGAGAQTLRGGEPGTGGASGLMVGDKDGLAPVREVKDAPLGSFAIAGADGQWHWGEATIVGSTVEVRSDKVPRPVRVRYAYSMNPKGPKLYNREGLPASPFRTYDWDATGR